MSQKKDFLSDIVNPTERQREFLDAVKTHRFTLYGGAAGGGKSYILRWANVWLLLRWAKHGIRNARVGIFCEDYPALRDRHLDRIRLEFPEWLGTYRGTDHDFVLKPEYGGGVISFRNLDDVSKYLSAEFAAITVDELTRNGQDIFDFLRMRLRWPGIEDTRFMAATNPGSKGHGWVKNLWIDRNFPAELEKDAEDFVFVKAKVTDNPHVAQSYIETLKSLPEHLRKAYLDGSWDIFSGQVFTEFSRDVHVVEPFPIPEAWPKFRALDWGYSKPYSVGWYAVGWDGQIYRYRELYGCVPGSPDTGVQEDVPTVAAKIRALEGKEEMGHSVADSAIWAQTGSGPTIAEQFVRAGVVWVPADKGPGSRIQGKMQCHARLKAGAFKVFSTCPDFIRTIPTLVYDEHKVEDVDTRQEDHIYDEWRYALSSRPMSPEIPQKPKRRDAYDDWGEEDDDRSWMSA